MKTKMISLITLTLVSNTSYAFIDKVVREAERTVNNAGKAIENGAKDVGKVATEAVKAVATAPVVVVEESAKIIEKNTGGDVSKVAGNIASEADKAQGHVNTAIEGGIAATEQTLKDPKKGLPRLMACSATMCASEVVAQQRAEEIRKQKQAEFEQKVKEAEARNADELRNVLTQRITELEEEKKSTHAQLQSASEVLSYLELSKQYLSPSAFAPPPFLSSDSVNSQESIDVLQQYFSAIQKNMNQETKPEEQQALVDAEKRLTDLSALNNMSKEEFIATAAGFLAQNAEQASLTLLQIEEVERSVTAYQGFLIKSLEELTVLIEVAQAKKNAL